MSNCLAFELLGFQKLALQNLPTGVIPEKHVLFTKPLKFQKTICALQIKNDNLHNIIVLQLNILGYRKQSMIGGCGLSVGASRHVSWELCSFCSEKSFTM